MQRVLNSRPRDNANILKTLTHALVSLATPHPNQGNDLLEKIRELLGHARRLREWDPGALKGNRKLTPASSTRVLQHGSTNPPNRSRATIEQRRPPEKPPKPNI